MINHNNNHNRKSINNKYDSNFNYINFKIAVMNFMTDGVHQIPSGQNRCYKKLYVGSSGLSYSMHGVEPNARTLHDFRNSVLKKANLSNVDLKYGDHREPNILLIYKDMATAAHKAGFRNCGLEIFCYLKAFIIIL